MRIDRFATVRLPGLVAGADRQVCADLRAAAQRPPDARPRAPCNRDLHRHGAGRAAPCAIRQPRVLAREHDGPEHTQRARAFAADPQREGAAAQDPLPGLPAERDLRSRRGPGDDHPGRVGWPRRELGQRGARAGAAIGDTAHRAAGLDDVNAPAGVFSEGHERKRGDGEPSVLVPGRGRQAENRRPDRRAAVVAVDVAARQLLQPRIANHGAAGDRRAAAGRGMAVIQDRRRRPGHEAEARPRVGEPPLAGVPAEVQRSTSARLRREVDLLARVLPHVGDVKRPCLAVEGEAERVAQAPRPDQIVTRDPHVWVVERDPVGVRLSPPRVDAQQLAEPTVEVLPHSHSDRPRRRRRRSLCTGARRGRKPGCPP